MNKIFLNKIKYLFLPVLFALIVFLVIPNITSAAIGTGIFDFHKASLDAVEEVAGPIAATMVNMVLIYVFLLAILWAVTKIFDWIIWQNLEHIAIDSEMVRVGFDFISGLANMALILIFIVLAFAVILKIESLEVKKTLPRLIIVALLLNFSLVFIGMAIDMTNIIYNTLLTGMGASLFATILFDFVGLCLGIAGTMIATLVATTIALKSVVVAPFVQAGFVYTLPLLLPLLSLMVFQMIIFVLLSGMFLLYIFIFAARMFVIPILAILSPLVFLCLIIPQTKKYFNMWLKHFLGWLFVGIFFLFFLRLGFLIFPAFKQGIEFGWFFLGDIGEFFIFYLFIVIYLGILAILAKKFMPEFAQVAISAAKGMKKIAPGAWSAVGGKHSFRHGPWGSKTPEKANKIAEKGKQRIRETEGQKGFGSWAKRTVGKIEHKVGTDIGIGSRMGIKKEEAEINKELEGLSNDDLIATANTSISPSKKRYALKKIAEEGELKKAREEGSISDEQIKNAYLKLEAGNKGSGLPLIMAALDLFEDFVLEEDQRDKVKGIITKAIKKDPSKIKMMDMSTALADGYMKKELTKIYTPTLLREINKEDLKASEEYIKAIAEKAKITAEDLKNLSPEEITIRIESFKSTSLGRHCQSTPAFQEMGLRNPLQEAGVILAEQQEKKQKREAEPPESDSLKPDSSGYKQSPGGIWHK